MYLVRVTPFSKSVRADHLSYFSANEIAPGSIVTVPLRKKIIPGLVLECSPIDDLKQEIKQSEFGFKKIKSVTTGALFSSSFISAAQMTARFFASSTGSIINALVPRNILTQFEMFQFTTRDNLKKPDEDKNNLKYIIQTSDEERFSNYKNIIRGTFAKNKSVFFCVPTIEDAMSAQNRLTKGIESSSFIIHSGLSKKKLEETWQRISTETRPCVVIGTAKFLGVPIQNMGTIIIERENSVAYQTMTRPYFDLRKFAEAYAETAGATIFFGDMLLRAETLWRFDNQELVEYTPIKFRSLTSAETEIVDMKKEREISGEVKKYSVLSNKLAEIVTNAHTNNNRTFLFVSRKGLAPLVVCGDCGTVVTCRTCNAPVVLYGKNATERENFFKCHSCGEKRHAGELCKKCVGWRLITLGIGTEGVAQSIQEILPEAKVTILDKDTAKTSAKAREIISEFLKNPRGILVGTEMALLYLREPIENVGIVSIDSMFSLPDFHIKERVLNILLRARTIASHHFIVQTRQVENSIFEDAVRGNLAHFYRQEFIDRKKFNYPPFSIIIKVSAASKDRAHLEKEFAVLEQYFAPHQFQYFPAFRERVREFYIMNGVIKIPREKWIDPVLAEKLMHLGPQYKVVVDAESVI